MFSGELLRFSVSTFVASESSESIMGSFLFLLPYQIVAPLGLRLGPLQKVVWFLITPWVNERILLGSKYIVIASPFWVFHVLVSLRGGVWGSLVPESVLRGLITCPEGRTICVSTYFHERGVSGVWDWPERRSNGVLGAHIRWNCAPAFKMASLSVV